MSKDDLLALYQQTSESATYSSDLAYNTPYYYVIRSDTFQPGGRAYSKLTGKYVTLCKELSSSFRTINMLCTLVVVQFSMTDLSCRSSDPSSARLDYYTTPHNLCQELFQTFSKSFLGPRPPFRGEPYYFTILFSFCQGDF